MEQKNITNCNRTIPFVSDLRPDCFQYHVPSIKEAQILPFVSDLRPDCFQYHVPSIKEAQILNEETVTICI